jgi:hypothetical protein
MCLPADIETSGFNNNGVADLKRALDEWEKRRFPNQSFNWGKGRLNFESDSTRIKKKK